MTFEDVKEYLSQATHIYENVSLAELEELTVAHYYTVLNDIGYLGTNSEVESLVERAMTPSPVVEEEVPLDTPAEEEVVQP
jgi:hypothetical protein